MKRCQDETCFRRVTVRGILDAIKASVEASASPINPFIFWVYRPLLLEHDHLIMSAFILPASGGLSNKDNVWTLTVALGVLYSTYSLLARIYSVYFGPLSKIPGPKLRAFTRIPDVIATVRGTKDRELVKLHGKYGVAVRIRPREVSYAASPEVWKEISGFKSVTYAHTHTHTLLSHAHISIRTPTAAWAAPRAFFQLRTDIISFLPAPKILPSTLIKTSITCAVYLTLSTTKSTLGNAKSCPILSPTRLFVKLSRFSRDGRANLGTDW